MENIKIEMKDMRKEPNDVCTAEKTCEVQYMKLLFSRFSRLDMSKQTL